MMRKRNSHALFVEMQAGLATVENSMEVPQKVKNKTALGSSNCTTRYLFPKYKNTIPKGYINPYVYCSIIYNNQIREAAQVSIDRWMDKEDVGCVCVCVCVYTLYIIYMLYLLYYLLY